jgi:hypothetical protein
MSGGPRTEPASSRFRCVSRGIHAPVRAAASNGRVSSVHASGHRGMNPTKPGATGLQIV